MSYKSDFLKLVTRLEAQGWRVKRRASGHMTFYAPNGKDMVTASGTPSDSRAWLNFRSQLKRAGYSFSRGPLPRRKPVPPSPPAPEPTPVPIAAPEPPAEARGPGITVEQIDADVAALDRLLSGLVEFETIVRRYREALLQQAAFLRTLRG